jgi:ABC-type glycerol-3-phosphate transport system substrate-binding protein
LPFRYRRIGRRGVFGVSRRILWSVAIALPALAGCPTSREPESPGETLPFVGQKVRIGVPAELGFRTIWEGPLKEWTAQSGAECGLIERPSGHDGEVIPGFANGDGETLAIFPLENAGTLIAAGALAPIPESQLGRDGRGLHWSDLFEGLAGKIGARKGVPYLVPLSCPVLVCYYRQDLLNSAGFKPPQTWEEYQQLLDKLESWAPGLTAVEPWSESFRATMFLARAVSYAQHPSHYSLFFDIETGDPLIDGPAYARALEAARKAVAAMPAEVLSYDPIDCRNAVLQGRAALAIAFETAAGGLSAAAGHAPPTSGERPDRMSIGFILLPGSREIYNPSRRTWEAPADKGIQQVTLCSFSGMAIAASSRNSQLQTEAGWNALVAVAGRNMTAGFPAGVIGICRESQIQNPGETVGAELGGEEALAYAEAVGQSLRDPRVVSELPVAGRAEFRRALAASLGGALDGSQTAEAALQAAAREWRSIIERLGAAKVRDDYRSNLGLSPLSRK